MANGDLTPDNLQFTPEDVDVSTNNEYLQGPPSDLEYDIMFQNFSDSVNSIVYPTPQTPEDYGPSGENYNPYKSNVTLSDSEESMLKDLQNIVTSKPKNPKPLMPIMTNKRLTNYERYTNHPKFQELGFNPFRDNESLYNQNSGFMDDFSRTMGQFPKLLYTGFVSSYRSLGDLFDDDSYFTGKDLDSAREFSDAMRIGNSTRGGVGGFLNNLVLQSGYTFGIIGNVFVEEALFSFATGGGSLLSAPVRAVGRTVQSIKKATRFEELAEVGTRRMLNNLNSVDEAKTFFQAVKTGDSKLMSFILPETMETRRLLNTTNNAANNLTDIGKTMKTFGGFYRDLRSLNYALAEGKMEAGMVYDERIANGLASRMKQSETGVLSEEDLQIIKDGANKASMYTTLLNAPFIYFTNQLLLGNAFGTYNKSLARLLKDNTDPIAKRILRNKPILDKKTGKLVQKKPFSMADDGIKGYMQKRMNMGVGGLSGLALRYFADNFGEGIQEVYQEAVAHGVGHYYDSIISDPTSATKGLFQASLSDAISSQFTGQGFHTFMSGFLMGGLVGPTQNLLFSGVPNFTRKYITDRKGYAQDKANLEAAVKSTVESYNKAFSAMTNDKDFFDFKTINVVSQKHASEQQQKAVDMNSIYDFLSAKDISKFQNIYTLLDGGAADMFRSQLKDYLKMSDEDLKTAFPALNKEVKQGKIKERLTSYLNEIDKVEELYNNNKNKYINPFDPSMYDPETQREEYFKEKFSHRAYKHAQFLAIFTANQMRRAGERLDSLFQTLQNDPIYSGMAANDITVLLSENSLRDEITLLKKELKLLEENQENKELIAEKQSKLKGLEEINDYLNEKHELLSTIKKNRKTAKGKRTELNWNKFKKERFKKIFAKYINNLASNKGQTVDDSKLDDYIEKIFDYSQLQIDQAKFRNSFLALSNPEMFGELYEKSRLKLEETYKNKDGKFQQMISKLANDINLKNWVNELADEGIYVDPDEVIEFVESGYDISKLKTFNNESGALSQEDVKDKLDALKNIILPIKEEQKPEEEEEVSFTISETVQEIAKTFGLAIPTEPLSGDQSLKSDNLEDKIYGLLRDHFNDIKTLEDAEKKYSNEIKAIIDALQVWSFNKKVSIDEAEKILVDFLNDETFEQVEYFRQVFEVLDTEELKDALQEEYEKLTDTEEYNLSAQLSEIADIILSIRGGSIPLTDEQKQIYADNKDVVDNIVEQRRGLPEDQEEEMPIVEVDGINLTLKKIGDKYFIYKLVSGQPQPLNNNEKNYFEGSNNTYTSLEDSKTALENIKPNVNFVYEFNYKGEKIKIKDRQTVYDSQTGKDYEIDISTIFKDGKIKLIRLENGQTEVLPPYTDVDKVFQRFTTEKPKQGNSLISSVHNEVLFIKENSLTVENYQKIMMLFNFSGIEDQVLDNYFTIEIINEPAGTSKPFQPNDQIPANNNLEYKPTPYNVRIVLTPAGRKYVEDAFDMELSTNTVGYINTGNLLYKFNDAEINPLDMTFEQAKLYYQIDTQEQFTDIQNNLAIQAKLALEIGRMLGDKQSITLSIQEFKDQTKLGIKTYKQFNYDSKNPVDPKQNLLYQMQGLPFMVLRNVFVNGVLTYQIADNGNIKNSSEAIAKAEEHKDKQGYVYVVQQPNGEYVYIPLISKTLNDDQIIASFEKIKNDSEKGYKGAYESDFFIALEKGVYVNVFISEKGDVTFNYKNLSLNKSVNVKYSKSEFANFDLNSVDVLIDQLNNKIQEQAKKDGVDVLKKITRDAFKRQFPKNASAEVIMDNTETDLQQNVYKRYNMQITSGLLNINTLKNELKDTSENIDNKQKGAGQEGKDEKDDEEKVITLYSNMTKPQLIAERDKVLDYISELNRKKNRAKDKQQIREQLKLLKEKRNQLNKLISSVENNLIISDEHTERSVEDINTFIEWLQNNLPDFITISDLNQLKENMLKGGKRVGAFMIDLKNIAGRIRAGGTIFTESANPGKYHEAFHAVFRLLLSDAEISKYIKIGRKELKELFRNTGKNYQAELASFKNQDERYSKLSDKRLEELFVEEYIAERFDEFKSNPRKTKTSSVIKSLFNRIYEFIVNVLTGFRNSNNKQYNSLNELFLAIDTGKYKSSSLMDNRFVQEFEQGAQPIVNALINYDEYDYLDSTTADSLISQIYARVIVQQEKSKGAFNIEKSIDESIRLFKELYDRQDFDKLSQEQEDKYSNVYDALENYSDQIKKEVLQRLKFINLTQENLDELTDEEINEVGLNATNFSVKSELIGMEKSLPEFVRKYIASTTMIAQDFLGNEILTPAIIDEETGAVIQEEERIVKSVSFGDVYHGVLRSTHDVFDHNQMFIKLLLSSKTGNPETKAFVDRLLDDLGLDYDSVYNSLKNEKNTTFAINAIINKNPSFFHKIFKAFENSKFAYRFTTFNNKSEVVSSYESIESASVAAQIQKWSNDSYKKYRENQNLTAAQKEKLSSNVNGWFQQMKLIGVNDNNFYEYAQFLSSNIYNSFGISLHPNYIFYSLAITKDKLTPSQNNFFIRKFKQSYRNITPIDFDDLSGYLASVAKDNSFMFKDSDVFQKDLYKYAYGNMNFDESVGSTTFTNPEDERVYAHQLPTLNAKFIYELKNSGNVQAFFEELIKNDPILKYNYLTNKDFVESLGYDFLLDFKYERIAGVVDYMSNEESTSDEVTKSGRSYGKLNPKQFLRILLSNYVTNINFKGQLNSPSTPVFTRVAETSRTGPTYQLPIFKAINQESGKLTEELINVFYNYVKGEFERIQAESDTRTEKDLIEEYNAVQNSDGELVYDTEKTGTAFTLFKTKAFLNNNLRELAEDTIEFSNKKILEIVENTQDGEILVNNNTKLAKEVTDFNKVYRVNVKSGKKTVQKYFMKLEDAQGVVKLAFMEDFDTLVDKSLTTLLEEAAQKSENRDKTFEQVLDELLSTKEKMQPEKYGFQVDTSGESNFKEILERKLNKEIDKFFDILNIKDLNINDIEFASILNGASKDLESIDNEQYKQSTISNLQITNQTLNLLEKPSTEQKTDVLNDRQINNLKQIFFNHYVNSYSINQLIRGDHAKLYSKFQTEIKRGKDTEAQVISTKSYVSDSSLGVDKPVDSFDVIVLQELLNKSIFTGKDIEEADGQLYMTVQAFRHAWFGIGALTPEQNAILVKLERGDKITLEDVWGTDTSKGLIARKEMINPKKFIYSDAVNMIKMSANVLRRADTSIEENEKWVAKPNMIVQHLLLDQLEANEQRTGTPTLAAPVSAFKKMKKGFNNIHKVLGTPGQMNVEAIDAAFLGLQMVNPSNKIIITDPTQITFLLENEQDDSLKVFINGEEFTLQEIKEAFEKNKSEILDLSYRNKKALIFEEGIKEFRTFRRTLEMSGGQIIKPSPNLTSFLRYAMESLKASNSSSEVLEFFDLSQKFDTAFLNNPKSIQKFEDLLLSYFSKSVLKQKIPGSQLTLKSDFGDRVYKKVYSVKEVEVNGEILEIPDRVEVIKESVALKSRNDYTLHIDYNKQTGELHKNIGSDENLKGLKQLVEDSKGEGVIIIDRLRYDVTEYMLDEETGEYKPTGNTYAEAKVAIQDPRVFEYFDAIKDRNFTNEDLQGLYEIWLDDKSYIDKKGNKVARRTLKNWDDTKGKMSFAKQMKTWYDAKTDTFGDTRQDKIPDVIAKMFGLRIPSQDKHSSLSIRIVDFIDVTNGSAIVVAREIVEVSGSDFDIDKLFAQFKEYYYNKKNKTFVEIGLEEENIFYEFIQYVNEKVNDPGTVYYEAYEKYVAQGNSLGQIKLDEFSREEAEALGMNEKAIIALTMIGMPITKVDFDAFEQQYGYYPFAAPLNNKILDQKAAMVSNKAITSVQKLYFDEEGNLTTRKKTLDGKNDLEDSGETIPAVALDPANMKPLEDVLKSFEKKFPEWKKTVLDETFDNDSITGALLAYINNQMGSRLIGASVLPNAYLPKLGTLGISVNVNFELLINGKVFKKYGAIKEKIIDENGNVTYGYRTQYVMSAIITAMTDNAKAQYAGKFNININSLSVLSNMVMLGVPLETGIMMTMNPYIVKTYGDEGTGKKFKRRLNQDIASLKTIMTDNNIKFENNVSNKTLEDLINSNMNLNDIIEKSKDGQKPNSEEKQFLSSLYSLLYNYRRASDISDYNYNLGVLFGIQKGVKKTSELDQIESAIEKLGLEEETLDAKKHPYNAKKLFVDEGVALNKIIKKNYEIYNDIKTTVLPELVLTQTPQFKDLYNSLIDDIISYATSKGRERLKYDLASYLNVKMYMKNMQGDPSIGGLLNANSYIHPFSNGNKNTKSISDVILEKIDELDIEGNFLLDEFINYVDYTDNADGINMLKNNLTSKIPDNRKQDILDDFNKLYRDENGGRDIALAIFHYLLAKDGMQRRYGSIMQAITSEVMGYTHNGKSYYTSVNEVFEKFKNSDITTEEMNEYFKEFAENYFIASSSYFSNDFGFKQIKVTQESIDEVQKVFEENKNLSESRIMGQLGYSTYVKDGRLVFNPYSLSADDSATASDVQVISPDISDEKLKSAKESMKKNFMYTARNSRLFKFAPYYQIVIDGVKTTYKLKKLLTSEGNQEIDFDNKAYLGFYAQYEEVKPVGSKAQWGAGFLFGDLMTNEDIIEKLEEEKNQSQEEQQGNEAITAVENLPDTKDKQKEVVRLIEKWMDENNLDPSDYIITDMESLAKMHADSYLGSEEEFFNYLKCNLTKNKPF